MNDVNKLHPGVKRLLDHGIREHDNFTRKDWRDEVAEEDTCLGYWEWLSHKLEEEERENE